MYKIVISISILMFLFSCGQSNKPKSQPEAESKIIDSLITNRIVGFENSLFSIPSPHQITLTLKQQNVEYNPSYLNPTSNTRNYTNSYKKALNMGVYGADLGYLNTYEKTQEAITYFSVIKTLSQELGIINSLKKDTFERIEKNLSNQDSLLHLLSNSYQDIDIFLKSNDQGHIGALILAGGWIESLYLLSRFSENNNQELISRLGENKNPLENLIKVISLYTENNRIYQVLLEKLIALEMIYQNVEVTYTYNKTEVNPEQKLTKVYSNTNITISDDVLNELIEEIKALRLFIIS